MKLNKSIKVKIEEELLNYEPLLKTVSGTKEVVILDKFYIIFIFLIFLFFIFLKFNILISLMLIILNFYILKVIFDKHKYYKEKQSEYMKNTKRELEQILPLVPIYSKIDNDEIIFYTKLIIYNGKNIFSDKINSSDFYFNKLTKEEIFILIGIIYTSNELLKDNPNLYKVAKEETNVCLWNINGTNFKLVILDENHNKIYSKELDLSKEEKDIPEWSWKNN